MSAYTTWIKALVDEFKIDGLRIDGKSADIASVVNLLTIADKIPA